MRQYLCSRCGKSFDCVLYKPRKNCYVCKPANKARSKSECHNVALKYSHPSDFSSRDKRIYEYARQKGWLEEICAHMQRKYLELSKQECKAISDKHLNRRGLRIADPYVYGRVFTKGWGDELFAHMPLEVGGYSKSRFIVNCCLSDNGLGLFYILVCNSEKESFYKFGITSKTLLQRYPRKLAMPYKYKVVFSYSGEGEDVWNMEQRVKHWVKLSKYEPNIYFKGAGECFI